MGGVSSSEEDVFETSLSLRFHQMLSEIPRSKLSDGLKKLLNSYNNNMLKVTDMARLYQSYDNPEELKIQPIQKTIDNLQKLILIIQNPKNKNLKKIDATEFEVYLTNYKNTILTKEREREIEERSGIADFLIRHKFLELYLHIGLWFIFLDPKEYYIHSDRRYTIAKEGEFKESEWGENWGKKNPYKDMLERPKRSEGQKCSITGEALCKCKYKMDPVRLPTVRETMRKLFTDHANYTHLYIMAEVFDLPTLTPVTERLLRNQEDIGLAFEPIVGEENSKKISALLREHILAASNVIKTAKKRESLEEPVGKLFQNSSEVSHLLSSLTKIPFEHMKKHFDEHNKYVIDLTTLYLEEKYELITKEYDCYYNHMLMFSDMLVD